MGRGCRCDSPIHAGHEVGGRIVDGAGVIRSRYDVGWFRCGRCDWWMPPEDCDRGANGKYLCRCCHYQVGRRRNNNKSRARQMVARVE